MNEVGQAPWVDEISRDDTQEGGLKSEVDEGIVGVTSNPTIFQSAIANSDLYDEQLGELTKEFGRPEGDLSAHRPERTSGTPVTY